MKPTEKQLFTLVAFLIAGVIICLIVACTASTIVHDVSELEKAKIAQQEKSERGHWLWGTNANDD